jgi:uncharacterized protein YxjI
MNAVLNKNLFFVKEHTGVFKAANNFDIYDPQTTQIIMECREDNLSGLTKAFRFTEYKRMTPFEIEIRTPEGQPLLTVKRGVSFFRSTVQVLDENKNLIGLFKQHLLSFGGKFEVQDANGTPLCMLKGKILGWDFKFTSADNKEFATVTKKWAGFAKEFFTTADNYVIQISEDVPQNHPLRQLILAAVMCIDFVLKE